MCDAVTLALLSSSDKVLEGVGVAESESDGVLDGDRDMDACADRVK